VTKRRTVDCALDTCDGSGWLDLTEDPDSEQTRCPCGRATEPPAEVADAPPINWSAIYCDETPRWGT
jgi:hypothetical protein